MLTNDIIFIGKTIVIRLRSVENAAKLRPVIGTSIGPEITQTKLIKSNSKKAQIQWTLGVTTGMKLLMQKSLG